MKKCPFCNSDIEDNSRFCLFCMTSLDDKKTFYENSGGKAPLFSAIAVAIIMTSLCIILLLWGVKLRQTAVFASEDSFTDPSASLGGAISSSSDDAQYSSDLTHSNTSEEHQYSSEAHFDNDTSPQSSSSEYIDPNDPKYMYEVIPAYDSFISLNPPHYEASNNQISIKSVLKPVESGHYVIPETIDGKEVICIEEYAFATVTDKHPVKSVTLPKTLKGMDYNTFGNCTELTDIYIPVEQLFGPLLLVHPTNNLHTITIHCPENLYVGLGFSPEFTLQKLNSNYNYIFSNWNG